MRQTVERKDHTVNEYSQTQPVRRTIGLGTIFERNFAPLKRTAKHKPRVGLLGMPQCYISSKVLRLFHSPNCDQREGSKTMAG